MKLLLVFMGFTLLLIAAGCTMTVLGFTTFGMHMIGWPLASFIVLVALDGVAYLSSGNSYVFDKS